MKSSPLEHVKDYHLTLVPSDWFNMDPSCEQSTISEILKYLQVSSQFSSLEMAAGAALLKFVSYTQRDVAPLVSQPSKFSHQTHMAIDSNTRRSLELTKPLMGTDKKATLFGVMNNTSTASGQRLLHSRLCAPSTEVNVIQKRLDAVEFFCMNRHLAEELQKALKGCPDIERKMQRVRELIEVISLRLSGRDTCYIQSLYKISELAILCCIPISIFQFPLCNWNLFTLHTT